MPRSIDDLLHEARSRIAQLTPSEAAAIAGRGGLLIDIRPVEQRTRDGDVPGALVIDRNVLEWRLDPASDHRIPEVTGYEQPIALLCHEGYASSLAAATLAAIGFTNAADVVGGFQAWRADGLPFTPA